MSFFSLHQARIKIPTSLAKKSAREGWGTFLESRFFFSSLAAGCSPRLEFGIAELPQQERHFVGILQVVLVAG